MPLSVSFWVNPLKTEPAQLLSQLQGLGLDPQPIEWMPGAWQVAAWRSPGHTLAFTAGWYYVQEAIAMAAVQALDPQPGERILDLCAAPGGKTAQIALRLQESGLVVANEMHAARLPSLTTTLARMGCTNVITTQADGRHLTLPPQIFDRVLVDVPCSGEGNLRRRRHPRPWQATHGARIAAAQRQLLSRALDLVKPGGTVVYSTCTFAPEENEAVLDAVLGDRAYLEPIALPGLRGQPGLSQWQGQSYREDIRHARRYWPHLNNTGGFFVAKLRRTAAALPPTDPPLTAPALPAIALEPQPPLQLLRQRFGLTSDLASYRVWATGKKRLWLALAGVEPLPGLHPQTVGIPLASETSLGLKATTAFLQRFGAHVGQNQVNLPDENAALRFVRGETQALQADVERGYVQVRYGNLHLGCGRYGAGGLESQLPKTLRWVGKQPGVET